MGFAELLTIVFIILKLVGVIGWAWWQVLLPEIIAAVVYILIIVFYLLIYRSIIKEHKRMMR